MHFGTELPDRVAALNVAIAQIAPALVVASGDFTQRARRKQFAAARAFLHALPVPWLAVPGNHDIPKLDLIRRIFDPLGRYHEYIDVDDAPYFAVPGLRVLGIDSTRRKVLGRLTPERIEHIGRLLDGPDADLRVLVTHHPLVRKPLEGAEGGLAAATRAGVDVLLAGHFHHFHAVGGEILGIEAGSAISARGERNSFNVISADAATITVVVWTFDGTAFAPGDPRSFARRNR